MFNRLNPAAVFRAHWGHLENRKRLSTSSDKSTKAALIIVPMGTATVVALTGTELVAPAALVSALALFSAGLLAAFAQIAAIRTKFARPNDDVDPDMLTREMLDEAIAHILTAATISVSTAVLILVGMNVGAGDGQVVSVWFSTPIAFLGIYLFLLFIMTIRKLYGAYDITNQVTKSKTEQLH